MNTKKNIALVYLGDFFFDARLTNMALSLKNENYNVSIISTYVQKINSPLFQDLSFYKISLSKKGMWKYLEFHKKVKSVLKQKYYDVIISSDLYSLSAVTASRKQTKKIIYDCREIYFELAAHKKKPMHRYWNYQFEKYHLKYVSHVMVTAESDLVVLKNKYKDKLHLKWHVIYNYPGHFQQEKPKQLLSKFIQKQNIKIIYQGVLQKGRGIKQLIDLAIYNNNISAVIVGGGEHFQHYDNYNTKNNTNNNVCFLGSIPYIKLLSITAQCDIGWAAIQAQGLSNQLALPNKIFEYIMAGIPIIASNLPNIKPIISNHKVGWIIQNSNIQEINTAIQKLVDHKTHYKKNLILASEKFNWKIQHQNFIRIINATK